MSFPFYNRLSSKPSRAKDAKEAGNKHASASFATGAFNHGDGSRANNSTHTRTGSKMRILPFLGKRRKSLATLRPSAVPEEVDLPESAAGGGRRHNKTVSQLANETAARLAQTQFGAAGSRSTSNLELPTFESSPFRLGLECEYATPNKARPPQARHTMFPSGSTQNSTPDRLSLAQNKLASEKPGKTSFLSRISSRPSLSARYSSADLKSTPKSRGFFKSAEKQQLASVSPQRKEIIRPMRPANRQSLGDDKNFFISPRVAPTPPNLSFASPNSSLLDSPVGPSRSEVNLPSQKQSPLFSGTRASRSPGHSSIKQTNAMHAAAKHTSNPTTVANPASLSPEMALRTPRRHSISAHNQRASPGSMRDSISAISATESPAARPRASHVRIGTEKVTISVANMLEAELGVEVGDSDSSYYDDSYESSRRIGKSGVCPGRKPQNESVSFNSSSDLPALSNSTDDFGLSFKFPKLKENTGKEFALEAQSPLSALISASVGDKDCSPSAASPGRPQAREDKRDPDSLVEDGKYTGNHPCAQTRATQYSRSVYLHGGLGSQSREVDRLDRISERSVSVRQESPHDTDGRDKKRSATDSNHTSSPAITSQLQRALNAQNARFDKLAGHLLQIIQRHQNEKVQLESQISILRKEAHRNEREIKALRKLIAHSDQNSSQEGMGPRRLVRIASMQSFLSDISVKDEEVDMSVAVDMLARAGRRNVLASPDISRDVRASIDLSPCPQPQKMLKNVDLRRSKTMPDLHKAAEASPSPVPSTPRDATPDMSGLGLGLDFPLPEPLKLPSIASTIMSSAKGSSTSVPALTAAPTAASVLSLATEPSVTDCVASSVAPVEAKSAGVGRGAGRNPRQKRMAGEWHPGGAHGLYRPAEELVKPPSAPPACAIPALPASASYANNLNKALMSSPIDQVLTKDSPDLDAIYKKLVSTANGLLE
ncbi:hypothetical protein ACEPAI_2587 [Sanghuangporus weigelae]